MLLACLLRGLRAVAYSLSLFDFLPFAKALFLIML